MSQRNLTAANKTRVVVTLDLAFVNCEPLVRDQRIVWRHPAATSANKTRQQLLSRSCSSAARSSDFETFVEFHCQILISCHSVYPKLESNSFIAPIKTPLSL